LLFFLGAQALYLVYLGLAGRLGLARLLGAGETLGRRLARAQLALITLLAAALLPTFITPGGPPRLLRALPVALAVSHLIYLASEFRRAARV
jgi:hypothetical protein